ncbi:hypothetical protein D6C92_10393 [Aureobasidium pullulans]|nr:hypothetical protein D6C92_10393 [Aureobasidium pullulans]
MFGNAPSNDEEAMSSQRPQEESGATALQKEADPQPQGQRPQCPSEDDWRDIIDDLSRLKANVTLRLARYKTILLVRDATRPSTPVPSEISVDQLSTQQILDLRRIVEHDIREANLLTDLRDVHQRYFLSINQIKFSSQPRAIALISTFPIVQSPSLLTLIIREPLQDTPPLHAHSTTTTALSPQTSQPVIAASSFDWRLLCSPCHRLPSIAMTTPHTTLDDTGQADSSEDTQEMKDTQEYAAAQPGRTDGEAKVVVDPNSYEAAEQIWIIIVQKIEGIVEQYRDEMRTTGLSIHVAGPASAWAQRLEEQSRLLRNRELSTLSRSEIAILRTVVRYETDLALNLTSLRVSSLKTIDALEALQRDNERNISQLEAIVPVSLAPWDFEYVLRRDLRSILADKINSIMARAREIVMEGRLFGC